MLKLPVNANTTYTEARTSSENVTSRFCNLSHYACKMCFNPGIYIYIYIARRGKNEAKCPKMEDTRAKRVKLLFVRVKYANL